MVNDRKPTAFFAESIPADMESLRCTHATAESLIELVDAAEHRIDLTAMYWALKPNPARSDEEGFEVARLNDKFGAEWGVKLYEALDNAAKRKVVIRILQSPGFDAIDDESGTLHAAHPDRVKIRTIQMPDWYGSGIMHQKIWVFDNHSFYLGSANMDWKSLTQVKELGIVMKYVPDVAAEVTRYFDTWWEFASLHPAEGDTETIFDDEGLVERRVPAWSPSVPAKQAIGNPLDCESLQTWYGWDAPQPVTLDDEPGNILLSGAPQEVCVGRRIFDGDLLVKTILDAQSTVCISVMDFAPVSLYRGMWSAKSQEYVVGDTKATPIWWPALIDALLHVVTARTVEARLLVSKWAHTSPFIQPFLKALAATAQAAAVNDKMRSGTLEVRIFEVPDWEHTSGESRLYPGHTRVNHTKYVVTDRRYNVGTSNMTWDYFHGTAGASLNGDHLHLRQQLQKIFDRDWNSDYAMPLETSS